MFKLDQENKEIQIDITIWTSKQIETKRALAKPFTFMYPLDFDTKESKQEIQIYFDKESVLKNIKIDQWQAGLLKIEEEADANKMLKYKKEH